MSKARQNVESPNDWTIALSPEEQLAFWTALQAPPKLTAVQKRLGALMQG